MPGGTGQKTALITTHQHKLNPEDPPYFDISDFWYDQEWKDTLSVMLKKYLVHKTKSDVNYYDGKSFNFLNSANTVESKVEVEADFQIYVSSEINLSGGQSYKKWGPNYTNFDFRLFIGILDVQSGKTYFKKSTNIPFNSQPAEYIYGPIMGKNDFFKLYIRALNRIFLKQPKGDREMLSRGRNLEFRRFTNEAQRYTIVHEPEGRLKNGERFVNGTHTVIKEGGDLVGKLRFTALEPRKRVSRIGCSEIIRKNKSKEQVPEYDHRC